MSHQLAIYFRIIFCWICWNSLNILAALKKSFDLRKKRESFWYLRLSRACNKPGQSFHSTRVHWLEGLAVCLPAYLATCTHSALAPIAHDWSLPSSQADILLKPASQSGVLREWLWEGGLKGGVGFFPLDTFKIYVTLSVYQAGFAYPTYL
jgi:hypothetical protein